MTGRIRCTTRAYVVGHIPSSRTQWIVRVSPPHGRRRVSAPPRRFDTQLLTELSPLLMFIHQVILSPGIPRNPISECVSLAD